MTANLLELSREAAEAALELAKAKEARISAHKRLWEWLRHHPEAQFYVQDIELAEARIKKARAALGGIK